MKIGKNVYLSSTIIETDLISISDGAVIDESGIYFTILISLKYFKKIDIIAHHFDGHELKLKEVKIGKYSSLGFRSVMLPGIYNNELFFLNYLFFLGSVLGNHSCLLPLSVGIINEKFPDNSIWNGSPAEMIQENIEKKTNL